MKGGGARRQQQHSGDEDRAADCDLIDVADTLGVELIRQALAARFRIRRGSYRFAPLLRAVLPLQGAFVLGAHRDLTAHWRAAAGRQVAAEPVF